MARKTAAEAARTRRTILQAAGDLFSREGVSDTTLEQIARQANVTRGAIYWHFKGKQDLLDTLFNEQRLPLEVDVPQSLDFSSGWQRLHDDLVATISGETSRCLSEIMLYQGAYGADPAAHQRRFTQVRQSLLCHLQVLLERAVARAELPTALDIPGVVAFFRLSITGLLYECLQDKQNPLEAVSSTLAVLKHVVNAPPRHLLLKAP
ncbi:TetR family transcriptional regulator [Pseudomonas sp. H9]|uniref:TetR family transcriptional regulator n=1 Tax=Pseudomonas sp. H9 TaxID=483968 RepID=UPI0010577BB8|nr:TetR family transcriptional regulator [Pseudomonas sp. H9]TDF80712.1 TetR family transcriptional regulator [Pseudomonas sp. H9]